MCFIKSLTIHYVTAKTLGVLQETCNVSQLSNLTELALYRIDCPDLVELRGVLILYSRQLQTITADVRDVSQLKYLIEMMCKIGPLLAVLSSLQISCLSDERLPRWSCYTSTRCVDDVLHMLSSYESMDLPLSINNLHISHPSPLRCLHSDC